MNKQEKLEWLISPEKNYPDNIRIGNLTGTKEGTILGNNNFITTLETHINILREYQYWSKKDVHIVQEKRLNNLLKYIFTNSEYWRSHLQKNNFSSTSNDSFSELSKLPIVDKDLFKVSKKAKEKVGKNFYIVKNIPKENLMGFVTSGTSGAPKKIIRTYRETVISRYPAYFSNTVFSKEVLYNFFNRKFIVVLGGGGANFILPDFVHTSHPISIADIDDTTIRQSIYESIHEASPIQLDGFATLLSRFSEYVHIDRVTLPITAIRIAAEQIPSKERESISNIFKAPIINNLNTSEGGQIGFECSDNLGKFHFNSNRIILEVVDENSELLPSGKEGSLVITVLDSFVTPILRYNTGDKGKLLNESCPCGRTQPLFEFHGRVSDMLRLKNGKIISSMSLYSSIMKNKAFKNVLQFQIQQKGLDRLHVLIIPKKNYTSENEFKLRLALTKYCGDKKMIIDVEQVEDIPTTPGGKSRFFIPME